MMADLIKGATEKMPVNALSPGLRIIAVLLRGPPPGGIGQAGTHPSPGAFRDVTNILARKSPFYFRDTDEHVRAELGTITRCASGRIDPTVAIEEQWWTFITR